MGTQGLKKSDALLLPLAPPLVKSLPLLPLAPPLSLLSRFMLLCFKDDEPRMFVGGNQSGCISARMAATSFAAAWRSEDRNAALACACSSSRA
jgi:hypothetical protein